MKRKATSLLCVVLLAICCMTLGAENLPWDGHSIKAGPYNNNSAVNLQNISDGPPVTQPMVPPLNGIKWELPPTTWNIVTMAVTTGQPLAIYPTPPIPSITWMTTPYI